MRRAFVGSRFPRLAPGPLVALLVTTTAVTTALAAPAPPRPTRPVSTVTIREDGATRSHGTDRLVPDRHTVQRGDTLWTLCDTYFGDPWQWPRIWSYNPDIVNPHWIYPGEVVRLRSDGALTPAGPSDATSARRIGADLRPRTVVPGTVFLREQGFLYDDQLQDYGEVAGSPEDKMLLSALDRVYIRLGPKMAKVAQAGDTLTIYQRTRAVQTKSGKSVGQVVQILGSVKLTTVDRSREIAQGVITESLDVIERGAHVSPLERSLQVVSPTTNQTELRGEVLTSVHPNQMFGQFQVVFIDKGQADGLRVGNRLFVIRKGDPWREGLSSTGQMAAQKVTLNVDGAEVTTNRGEKLDNYPEEVLAEIRVVSTRQNTATCVVTASRRELAAGDTWVAKKGY